VIAKSIWNTLFSNQMETTERQQHSLALSVTYHLFPGLVILAAYLGLVPSVTASGYPPLLALLIAAFLGVLPIQLGHLLYLGRTRNHRWSLTSIVLYREPMKIWQYLLFVPLLAVTALVLVFLTRPLDDVLVSRLITRLPQWFFYSDVRQYARYSIPVLRVVFAVRLAVDGLVLPIVEELYFRGYLLPRIDRFGVWSPILHHSLFTLYHLWQPFNYPTILLGFFPTVWAVWYKRSVLLGIITHMVLNVIGGIGMLGLLAARQH
jgi:membrane protease YdiL (CAAX protease family)